MGSSSRGGLQSQDEDLALFQDMRMRERNAMLDSGPDIVDGRRASGGGAISKAGALASRAAAAAVRKGSSDLLTSEIESKNDYDWLLTPPGTPLFPSLDRDLLAAPSPPAGRKPSRLSASDLHSRAPGSGQSPMLVLDTSGSSASSSSASATRVAPPRNPSPSLRGLTRGRQPQQQQQQQLQSSTNSGSSLTAGMRRPSTPTRQGGVPTSTSAAAARPSTPTGRASMRPSTPTRPSPSSARPSTPTSRSSSISSSSSIAGSRPSTPTRRASTGTAATTTLPTMSSGRTSRGTSPMRSSMRQSPGPVVSTSSNTFRASEARPSSNSRSSTIPSSSPLLVKAELRRQTIDSAAAPGGGLLNRSYAHHSDREISSFSRRAVTSANDGLPLSSIRASMAQQQDDKSALSAKKSMRPSGMRETSFYGTSISKKSLDTAIRHMDIRRSTPGGFRSPLVSSNSELLKCSPPIVSRHQVPGRFFGGQAHGNGSSKNSSSSSSNGSNSNSNIGNSNSNRDLDMFSAATSGDGIDNFLLDSSSLDDLQSCNGDAGRSGFLEQEFHL